MRIRHNAMCAVKYRHYNVPDCAAGTACPAILLTVAGLVLLPVTAALMTNDAAPHGSLDCACTAGKPSDLSIVSALRFDKD
jgi:hypothetical protein